MRSSLLPLLSLFSLALSQNVDYVHKRVKRGNIPCGTSFTPCSTKPLAHGVITNSILGSEDEDEVSIRSFNAGRPAEQASEVSKIVSKQMLLTATTQAFDDVTKLFNDTENRIFQQAKLGSSEQPGISWSSIHPIDRYAKDLSYSSYVAILSTQHLQSTSLTREEATQGLPELEISGSILASICPVDSILECLPSKYRTYSGHCNNVDKPLQGAVYEPMQRLLPPDYSDGVSIPRRSAVGTPLPSARTVSRVAFTEASGEHKGCSMMLGQWAMFVYEDMVGIGSNKVFNGNNSKPLPCCDDGLPHPECYPIEVDSSDPVYAAKCIPYARTITAPRGNCSLGRREQGNQATSYLDASNVYGSTSERATKLRTFKNGLLTSRSLSPRKEILPEDRKGHCAIPTSSQACFLAGSELTNEIPTNAAMHTAVNPHWDDERLYQESRRIISAQIQHITYDEFIPVIVGLDNLHRLGLNLRNYAYDSDYDLNSDSSVLNEYASAVGLFFYALFPDELTFYEENAEKVGKKLFGSSISDPSGLYIRGRIDSTLRFLLKQPVQKLGLHMSREFRHDVPKDRGNTGLDFAANIIQMGRDHGIPGYTAYRSSCGLRRPSSFADLDDIVLESVNVSSFSQVYNSIDDVDLFVLGLAEKPEPGAFVGPTFACIIGRQFQQVRRGDRFWYENFFAPSGFTLEQLNEIRKTTLARVICDNTDHVKTIQASVFALADNFGNCPISCNSTLIDSIDVSQWADQEQRVRLPITRATIEKAIRLGAEHARRLNDAERARIGRQGTISRTPNHNAAVVAHSALMAPKKQSLQIARMSAILREATKVLVRGEGLDEGERLPSQLDISTLQYLLPEIEVKQFVGKITDFLGHEVSDNDECLPHSLPCDHTSKFRTFSGWCNNLKFPQYGSAFSSMRRLLGPAYDDGFDSPRTTARNGRQLPSARAISNAVHSEVPAFHVKYTHMLMQMGQILDHDFAHSPVTRGPGGNVIDCSKCDSHETVSVHCFPIPIERGDPHFPEVDANGQPRCMPFTRSLLGQLTLGYRNQLDQLTSFIDASFLYGSTECEANSLRLFSQGRMNFTNLGFNTEALPQGFQEKDCRSRPRHPCFNAGDERNNEQPGLTVLHTLFLREHNRIATALNQINSIWSDERTFLETRRIVGAKMQHIIFGEWLPIVVGCETAAKYDLIPKKTGYYEGYDERCDATLSQEMATAAFRFGHTLIRNNFPRMNGQYEEEADPLILKDSFNNASFYYNESAGHIESMIFGLLGVNSMAFDRHISDALRNHLLQKAGNDFSGMDLPALNIQRGRDHGVQPYNAYREMCGRKRATRFEELSDVMDESAFQALKSVYDHVDDVDLFPGLMSETPMKGAVVGPTLACILVEQFQRLKRCDRFYYENNNPTTRFTPGQLAEIRKTKLSKLVCDNSAYARRIQPNGFLMPDELTYVHCAMIASGVLASGGTHKYSKLHITGSKNCAENAPVKCSELPSTDLNEWLDRQFCLVDGRAIDIGKTKRVTPCVTCTCTAEGPECHAMVVEQCGSLLNDYSFSEIASDTVCVIQCSSTIRLQNGRL